MSTPPVRVSPSGPIADPAELPFPDGSYSADIAVSFDLVMPPDPRAFSYLQFPASNVGAGEWHKGAVPAPAAFVAGANHGALWSFDGETGELTYNGTRSLRARFKAFGELVYSIVLNGDPWPDTTLVAAFALDINGDSVGKNPGPGGFRPFGRYVECPQRFPATFGLFPGLPVAFEASVVVTPGMRLALVNYNPPAAGLIVITPQASQLTLSVDPLFFV